MERCVTMPRSSPFAIALSSPEEAELRRRAGKYTLPYFQVQRAKMILYAAEGMPNDEIAARLDTRREVVSLWRKRFFRRPPHGTGRTCSSGSSPDFSPQISSFRLRPWRVNCQRSTVYPYPAGAPATWFNKSSRAD